MIDLYPTLADLAGFKSPRGLEGKSLKPLLDDPTRPWKAGAYTQVTRGGGKKGTDSWAAASAPNRSATPNGTSGKKGVELYDHDADPKEHKNLAHDPAQAKTVRRAGHAT